MDKWILIVWLVSTLCWVDPVKSPVWLKHTAYGIAFGAILNALFLYLFLPALIPINIMLMLGSNLVLGTVFGCCLESEQGHDKKAAPIGAAGIVLFAAMLGVGILAAPFNTGDLYNLALIEEPTQDLLATSHKTLISPDNAVRLANNKLGQLGNKAKIEEARCQAIGGKLKYLLPLAYASYIRAWVLRDDGTNGYLTLSAENQTPEVEYLKGYNLRFVPSAVLGYDLKRHIWAKYPAFWQGDSIFQLDGNGSPVYVTVLDLPTVWSVTGDKPAGIVVTDPETGEMARYDASQIPGWVQQSYESKIVIQYLGWFGKYPHGFWNSLFAKKNVTTPVKDNSYCIYDTGEITIYAASSASANVLCGDNGRLYWTAAMGNPNDDSNSMTAYVAADAAKLPVKLMFYRINESIDSLGAAQNIQQLDAVSHVAGHFVQPLSLYNISGKYAWMGPVTTSYNEFAGVGLTYLDNGKAFFGQNLTDVYNKAGLDG